MLEGFHGSAIWKRSVYLGFADVAGDSEEARLQSYMLAVIRRLLSRALRMGRCSAAEQRRRARNRHLLLFVLKRLFVRSERHFRYM